MVTAVIDLLDRWFEAVQDGSVATRFPDTGYTWRFYKGEMTMERIRKAIHDLDEYMQAQISWVKNTGRTMPDATRGPDLGRMPDHALMAMFQEIDTLLAYLDQPAAVQPVLGTD